MKKAGLAGLILVPILALVLPLLAISGGLGVIAQCPTAETAAAGLVLGPTPQLAGLSPTQSRAMAGAYATTLQVGREQGWTPAKTERAFLIAGMTMMQESQAGDDPTSRRPNSDQDAGYYQQRVLAGWYSSSPTPEGRLRDVNDIQWSTRTFLLGNAKNHIPGLAGVSNWDSLPLTVAAQTVQVSAYPNAYAKWEGLIRGALAILKRSSVASSVAAAGATTRTPASSRRIVWPVPGHTTSTYTNPGGRPHDGLDINRGSGNEDLGDPISAAASGVVTYTGWGKGYGQAIFIKTDIGPTTIYGHTSKVYVRAGQRVVAGDHIGDVGNTYLKRTIKAHLHFGVSPGLTFTAAMRFLAHAEANPRGPTTPAAGGTSTPPPAAAAPASSCTTAAAGPAASTDALAMTGNVATVRSNGRTFRVPIPAGKPGIVLRYALAQVGKPYVYATSGPATFDCSGLTSAAWARAGVRITPQSGVQNRTLQHVPLSQAQPGDILWHPGHVQLNLGVINGKRVVVEAANPRAGVRMDDSGWMDIQSVLRPAPLP